jgi:hypothetical protein
MEATAKTFRYLDDDEIAAHRKATQGGQEVTPGEAHSRTPVRGVVRDRSRGIAVSRGRGDPNQTLKQWMDEQSKDDEGQGRSFPQVKPYVPFRLQRVRPAGSVQAAEDRAARGREVRAD